MRSCVLPSLSTQPLMIWMRSRFAPIASFSAAAMNVGALPFGAVRQVAAHRDALGVADRRGHAVVRVRRLEVPAAEEAHDHPRAGGGVGLAALHRVEDRLARVLGRPDGRVAGGADLPVHDRHAGLRVLDEGLGHALRARLLRRGLAEEVLLLHRGEAGVRVACCRSCRTCRGSSPSFASSTRPFLSAARAYSNWSISLVFGTLASRLHLSQSSKFGELVVRREVGVRLAGPLGLGRLVERLPPGARLGVALVDLLAEGLDHREHDAVAQVAVVGDGEHLAAGLLLGAAIHFQRSSGLSLPNGLKVTFGTTRPACAPFPRKTTLRCRLLAWPCSRSTRSR